VQWATGRFFDCVAVRLSRREKKRKKEKRDSPTGPTTFGHVTSSVPGALSWPPSSGGGKKGGGRDCEPDHQKNRACSNGPGHTPPHRVILMTPRSAAETSFFFCFQGGGKGKGKRGKKETPREAVATCRRLTSAIPSPLLREKGDKKQGDRPCRGAETGIPGSPSFPVVFPPREKKKEEKKGEGGQKGDRQRVTPVIPVVPEEANERWRSLFSLKRRKGMRPPGVPRPRRTDTVLDRFQLRKKKKKRGGKEGKRQKDEPGRPRVHKRSPLRSPSQGEKEKKGGKGGNAKKNLGGARPGRPRTPRCSRRLPPLRCQKKGGGERGETPTNPKGPASIVGAGGGRGGTARLAREKKVGKRGGKKGRARDHRGDPPRRTLPSKFPGEGKKKKGGSSGAVSRKKKSPDPPILRSQPSLLFTTLP